MDGLAGLGIFFAGFFGGLGIFFLGCGLFWWISLYAKTIKSKQNADR